MATVDTTMFPYTQPETSSTAGQTDFLDQEVFMTLLLEQLKNQDPMDPMETNDMTAQLAALAQVEELQSVNANLETLHTYQSALSNEQSVALIGKTVKAVGTTLNLGESGTVPVSFYLGGAAETVTVTISDEDGSIVRTLTASDLEAGDNELTWNGTDSEGNRLDAGVYEFKVEAIGEDGDVIACDTFIEGVVSSIRFEGGIPVLLIDGKEVTLGDVYEINLTPEDGAES